MPWLIVAAALAYATRALAAAAPEGEVLDHYPVCEASAAIEVPCTDDATRRCIWVGDNEQEGEIFQYDVAASGKLTPAKRFELKLGKAEVGDIEALAADDKGVIVVGSHSRKSNCEPDDDRVAVARVTREAQGAPHAVKVAGKQGFADRIAGCTSTMVKLEDAQPGSSTGALRNEFCATLEAT